MCSCAAAFEVMHFGPLQIVEDVVQEEEHILCVNATGISLCGESKGQLEVNPSHNCVCMPHNLLLG